MLLHRRDQRLDDKDVAFPAILGAARQGNRSHMALSAMAAEGRPGGYRFPRQKRMRATTKDGDFGQRPQPQGDRAPGVTKVCAQTAATAFCHCNRLPAGGNGIRTVGPRARR